MRRHGITATILGLSLLGTPAIASDDMVPVVFADEAVLQELGTWAIERFQAAGLELPEVEIHIHLTSEGCGGRAGSFNPTLGRVDVCEAEPTVVLHELGHVWAKAHLTDGKRQAYVAAGGFESWSDAGYWDDRG